MLNTNNASAREVVTQISVSYGESSSLSAIRYIYHQNVCGISTKKDELELYLENLDTKKPHYVCITEHFLNSTNLPLLNLTNFKLIAYNTRVNMTRGGSLILSREECNYEDVPFCKTLYKREFFEICGVRDIDSNLNICCLYRNDKKKHFDNFMEQMEKLLVHFFNKKCVICGDFNVNLLEDDKYKTDFTSLLKCYNFRPLNFSVTYICGEAQSCLDNILTNLPESSIALTDLDHNGLSDGHAGLLCKTTIENSVKFGGKDEFVTMERVCINEHSNKVFRQNIMLHDWTNDGINSFLKNFNEIFRKSFRKKERRVNIRKDQKLKWVTNGVKMSSKMKRVLMSVNKNTNDISVVNYRNNYIRTYRRVLGNAKRLAVQTQILKAENSSKEIWKVVNRHRNKQKVIEREQIVLKVSNNTIINPEELAQTFSINFDHSTSESSSDLRLATTFLEESGQIAESDMTWNAITPNDIYCIVRQMKNKRSSGYDDIQISIVKENIDLLKEPLAYLFNMCYEQGTFPEQLKIAKVLPVYKKGLKTDPKNYRPISLLPVLSKIFEKIVKKRLLSHLNANNIICKRQYGYQKGISTSDAIDSLIDDVVLCLNEKKKVVGLFLDLSSAFDTVDHEILIKKLVYYGITGKNLQLFKSYLQNRYQFVEISSTMNGKERKHTSKLVKVSRGVPQGSILGPLLFILFTNDLVDYISKEVADVKVVTFADDTSAVVSASDSVELERKTNRALSAFYRWFRTNNLKLNTSKTNVLLFKTTARMRETLNVQLNGERIVLVESVKFLGIYIDSFLNWKEELNKIESKISSACYAIRSLRDEATIEQLKIVYYALVESHLRYSIKFWGNSYEYNIHKAFVIQKRAIRTIVRIPQWQSCRQYFKGLNILTVPCLYILVLLTDVIRKPERYENVDDRQIRLGTRRLDLPFTITPQLNIVRHSVRHQAVKMFNCLPTNLKNINDSNVFGELLKRFLLEKNYYSIDEFTL